MQDASAINTYLKMHEDYFLQADMDVLRGKLLNSSDSKWNSVRLINLKSPLTILLISLSAGIYGVDRFLLEKKGSGVLKLIVCQLGIVAGIACFFLFLSCITDWGTFCLIWFIVAEIWWLFDVCMSVKWTKEYNYRLVLRVLNM